MTDGECSTPSCSTYLPPYSWAKPAWSASSVVKPSHVAGEARRRAGGRHADADQPAPLHVWSEITDPTRFSFFLWLSVRRVLADVWCGACPIKAAAAGNAMGLARRARQLRCSSDYGATKINWRCGLGGCGSDACMQMDMRSPKHAGCTAEPARCASGAYPSRA